MKIRIVEREKKKQKEFAFELVGSIFVLKEERQEPGAIIIAQYSTELYAVWLSNGNVMKLGIYRDEPIDKVFNVLNGQGFKLLSSNEELVLTGE